MVTRPDLTPNRTWMIDGNCYDQPHLTKDFYGDHWADQDKAKAICVDCPVKERCLEHAMVARELGVWGGTSEYEREKMRRRQRRWERKRRGAQRGLTAVIEPSVATTPGLTAGSQGRAGTEEGEAMRPSLSPVSPVEAAS